MEPESHLKIGCPRPRTGLLSIDFMGPHFFFIASPIGNALVRVATSFSVGLGPAPPVPLAQPGSPTCTCVGTLPHWEPM